MEHPAGVAETDEKPGFRYQVQVPYRVRVLYRNGRGKGCRSDGGEERHGVSRREGAGVREMEDTRGRCESRGQHAGMV